MVRIVDLEAILLKIIYEYEDLRTHNGTVALLIVRTSVMSLE